MGVGGSRKNKREGVVMDLLAHSFALTHISLKCLFTKKWEREKEREREVDEEEYGPIAVLYNAKKKWNWKWVESYKKKKVTEQRK